MKNIAIIKICIVIPRSTLFLGLKLTIGKNPPLTRHTIQKTTTANTIFLLLLVFSILFIPNTTNVYQV